MVILWVIFEDLFFFVILEVLNKVVESIGAKFLTPTFAINEPVDYQFVPGAYALRKRTSSLIMLRRIF